MARSPSLPRLLLLGSAICLLATAPAQCPPPLPYCNDVDYSDAQVDAAVQTAKAEFAQQGTPVEDMNSPNFVPLLRRVGAILGCRYPMGSRSHRRPRRSRSTRINNRPLRSLGIPATLTTARIIRRSRIVVRATAEQTRGS